MRSEHGRKTAETRASNAEVLHENQRLLYKQIRVLMLMQRMTLSKVCAKMREFGYEKSVQALSSKINNGKFSAAYYLLLMAALNAPIETNVKYL